MPFCKCPVDLKEVFRTEAGAVRQCDRQRCLIVDFAGTSTAYKIPCFFALKRLLDNVNVEAMITSMEKGADLEIVSPCGSERCYVLSATQILAFRDLLEGAKVMLQLNSILHERLYSIAV